MKYKMIMKYKMRINSSKTWLRLLSTLLPAFWAASAIAADLPDPDSTEADTSQPVKVFIIMGQSNTLELGKVKGGDGSLEQAVKSENLYPFMVAEAGNWTERKDVRNVSVMEKRGKMNVYRNDWLTVSGNTKTYMNAGLGMGEAMVKLLKE